MGSEKSSLCLRNGRPQGDPPAGSGNLRLDRQDVVPARGNGGTPIAPENEQSARRRFGSGCNLRLEGHCRAGMTQHFGPDASRLNHVSLRGRVAVEDRQPALLTVRIGKSLNRGLSPSALDFTIAACCLRGDGLNIPSRLSSLISSAICLSLRLGHQGDVAVTLQTSPTNVARDSEADRQEYPRQT